MQSSYLLIVFVLFYSFIAFGSADDDIPMTLGFHPYDNGIAVLGRAFASQMFELDVVLPPTHPDSDSSSKVFLHVKLEGVLRTDLWLKELQKARLLLHVGDNKKPIPCKSQLGLIEPNGEAIHIEFQLPQVQQKYTCQLFVINSKWIANPSLVEPTVTRLKAGYKLSHY